MTTALWIFVVAAVIDLWHRLFWLACNEYPRCVARSSLDDAAWLGFDLLVLGLLAYDVVTR